MTGDTGDEGKSMVLYPIRSAYAVRHPKFDAFSEQPLINNRYVDDSNNQCHAVIVHPDARFNPSLMPLDYSNTLFTAYTTEHRLDNEHLEE